MRRARRLTVVLAVAVAAALGVVAASPAKGKPKLARFCGPAACATVTSAPVLLQLAPFTFGPAEAQPVQPLPSPFVRFRFAWASGEPITGWYLPGSRMLETASVGGGFVRLPAALGAKLGSALRTLRPFAAPRVAELLLDGRRVRDGALARGLFAVHPKGKLVSTSGRWIAVDVRWASENPWSNEPRMTYHVPSRLLLRPDGAVRLPRVLAARLLAAAGG